jgi:hypothetical protein
VGHNITTRKQHNHTQRRRTTHTNAEKNTIDDVMKIKNMEEMERN